jgi:hypothetical protein
MSRHRSSGSYDQRLRCIGKDCYDMSWWVDFYYEGNRQRWPRRFSRRTDLAGAKRFAKRHGVPLDGVKEDV